MSISIEVGELTVGELFLKAPPVGKEHFEQALGLVLNVVALLSTARLEVKHPVAVALVPYP
jgi:hypothetical protein